MSEPMTPEWYNEIATRALGRIMEMARPVIDRYTAGGYIGGFVRLDIATLQKMPVMDALGLIANMVKTETARADGVKLFGQYLGYLERTGQLAPGAGKAIGQQEARAQARQLGGAG